MARKPDPPSKPRQPRPSVRADGINPNHATPWAKFKATVFLFGIFLVPLAAVIAFLVWWAFG